MTLRMTKRDPALSSRAVEVVVRPADSEGLCTHNKAHLETEVAWGKTTIQRARLKVHQLQQSEKVPYVFSCFCFYLFLGLKKERDSRL